MSQFLSKILGRLIQELGQRREIMESELTELQMAIKKLKADFPDSDDPPFYALAEVDKH